ncbi:MAG: hypothetical protein WCM76_10675 [Bacteroidota bacterium]
MKNIFFMILFAGLILSGCSGGADKTKDSKDADSTGIAKNNSEVKGRYGLKSAIIFMKSKTMGMEQDLVMYFDDYGAKQMTEITVEVMGMKSQTIALQDGDYMYTIDMKTKTGTKTKLEKSGPDNVNFQQLTDEVIKKFNIKKAGTGEVAGRTCEKFTMEVADSKMTGTYFIWKGIPLKTEASIGGISVSMEVTRIDENAAIAAEKFKIPAGVKIVETAEGK